MSSIAATALVSPAPAVAGTSASTPLNTIVPAEPSTTLPRKRRRRAPATGAADDCFACRKKGVKCDRRRPYCSPCLELGKECSGYKTQLTWGVGVASRGKLRGLSLPIVRKPTPTVAGASVNGTATVKAISPTKTTSCPVSRIHGPLTGRKVPSAIQTPKASTSWKQQLSQAMSVPCTAKSTVAVASTMTYDFVNMAPTGSPTIPSLHSPMVHSPGLSSPGFEYPATTYDQMESLNSPVEAVPSRAQPYLDQTRWGFETPMASPLNSEFGLSTSASSISGYSDSELSASLDFPPTPEQMSFMSTPFSFYNSALPTQQQHQQSQQQQIQQQQQQQQQAIQMWPNARATYYSRRAPTSYPETYPSASSMCSSLSSNPSSYGPIDDSTYGSDREQQQPKPQQQQQQQQQHQQQVQQQQQQYQLKVAEQQRFQQAGRVSQCNLSDMMYNDGVGRGTSLKSNDVELGFGYRIVRHDTPESPFLFDV